MRKRVFYSIAVATALIILILGFCGGYMYGKRQVCVQTKPVVVAKKVTTVKPVAKAQALKKAEASPPLPLTAASATLPPSVIPKAVAETERLMLRINVVEWSPVFEGKSPASPDIGPVIRRGLDEGTVKRTTTPVAFNVNGATVTIQNGQVVLDPGPIGPGTNVSISPIGVEKYVLPLGARFPLTVGSGELSDLVNKGVSEIWLNFLLAPR